jgi:hypothetical protein
MPVSFTTPTSWDTPTAVAGYAVAVGPVAVEVYPKLLNVRLSTPTTVVVFPFDTAVTTVGDDSVVVVSPGSS